ncbi:MAG: hypothetical protein JWO06_2437, partial [Bacteroidota bacterium]|nr:hypothetical protein [Bacteroidota bacterium]
MANAVPKMYMIKWPSDLPDYLSMRVIESRLIFLLIILKCHLSPNEMSNGKINHWLTSLRHMCNVNIL